MFLDAANYVALGQKKGATGLIKIIRWDCTRGTLEDMVRKGLASIVL
jgi:hypothetical protein